MHWAVESVCGAVENWSSSAAIRSCLIWNGSSKIVQKLSGQGLPWSFVSHSRSANCKYLWILKAFTQITKLLCSKYVKSYAICWPCGRRNRGKTQNLCWIVSSRISAELGWTEDFDVWCLKNHWCNLLWMTTSILTSIFLQTLDVLHYLFVTPVNNM